MAALSFALGLATAATLAWLIDSGEAPEADAASAQLDESTEASRGWLDERLRLQAQIHSLEAEIARLAGRAGEPAAAATAALPAAEAAADEGEAAAGGRPRSGFARRMEEQMANRAAEWTQLLGLSAAQADAVAALYSERMEHMRNNGGVGFDFDARMETILSPDQFAAYLDETQREIYNRAEMLATMQTLRFAQAVELSPQQHDLMYEALHYTAQEMMIARQAGADFDMRQQLNERLQTILSPEQLEAYQRMGQRGWGMGGP